MESMTMEQLRAASKAGGVEAVTLKGQGAEFLLQIATRSGTDAVLAKARSSEPRRFGNPLAALNVLRELGIMMGHFDARAWDPGQKVQAPGNRGRAEALRKAHQVAAYSDQLAADVQASLDDARPSIAHAEVVGRLDARIGRHKPAGGQRA